MAAECFSSREGYAIVSSLPYRTCKIGTGICFWTEKQSLKPQGSDAVLATNSAQHVNLLVVLFVGSIAGG